MMPPAPAEIVKVGHPALRKPARVVSSGLRESAAFDELITIMKLTLKGRGVGLAAPQIGVGLRAFVMEDPQERIEADRDARDKERTAIPFEVVINPVWRAVGEEMKTFMEGCLSIPEFREPVTRPRKVTIRAQDVNGKWYEKTGEELLARAFLHETEHLNGKLYISHISALKRDLMKRDDPPVVIP